MTSHRFITHVDINAEHRKMLIDALNTIMASSADLYTQVKQAHWNLKGPHFVSRHLLFDDIAAHLQAWTDDAAERISTLGGYAMGTARKVAENSELSEYDLDAVDGKAHIVALTRAYSDFTKLVRGHVESEPVAKEPVTEDLLIEILRGAEKDMWFLESHLNV